MLPKFLYGIINIFLILYYEIFLINHNDYILEADTNIKYILYAVLSFFMSDLLAYFVHYFLHLNKFLYLHIHSIHHRDKNPNIISTIHMHPVEISLFFFTYRLPLILGLPFTQTTFYVYQIVLILWTFLDHSFNQSIFHDHFLHHKYFYGNYATCLQFWDTLFKTKIRDPSL